MATAPGNVLRCRPRIRFSLWLLFACWLLNIRFACGQPGSLALPLDASIQREWQALEHALQKTNVTEPLGLEDFPVLNSMRLVEVGPGHVMVVPLALEWLSNKLSPPQRQRLIAALRASQFSDALRLPPSDELLQQGDSAWLTGDLETAGACWSALLATLTTQPPEARLMNQISRPQLVSRLAMRDVALQRSESARDWLTGLSSIERAAPGRLGGKSDTWQTLIEQASLQDRPSPAIELAFVRRRWQLPRPQRFSQSTHLGIWKSVAVIHEASGLRAVETQRGSAVWSGAGTGDINHDLPDTSLLHLPQYIEFPAAPPPRPVIDRDWYFARVGPLLLHPGNVRARLAVQPELVAINLQDPGVVAWRRTGEQLLGQPDWIVSGDPVVSATQVFLPLRTGLPQPRFALACLERLTGDVVWIQPAGSLTNSTALPAAGADVLRLWTLPSHKDTAPDWLGPALIIVNLEGRTVAAFSTADGGLRWSTTLAGALLTQTKMCDLWLDQQTAYALTSDNQLTALDVRTGAPRRVSGQLPLPVEAIVERHDHLIILSGEGVCALHHRTGQVVWKFQSAPVSSGAQHQTLAIANRLLHVTHDSLWCLDVRTGQILQRWPLESLGIGQQPVVALSGNTLLCADPTALTSFEIQQCAPAPWP